MPTRVKICGITRRDDAELAVELGAAALGFNFYPPSLRYIAPAVARGVILRLPPFVTAVGVFADETDAAHITAVADEAGVRVVQLHGTNQPSSDALWGYGVIRAVNIGEQVSPELLEEVRGVARSMLNHPYLMEAVLRRSGGRAAWVLLDTADPVLRGGTGRAFDWKIARQIAEGGRVILAGGLTPENVGEAIRQVHPYAVDVATGVECAPGIKDPAKLRALFAEVAKADREL